MIFLSLELRRKGKTGRTRKTQALQTHKIQKTQTTPNNLFLYFLLP